MIDNVVYERSVSECLKISYIQQQKYQKNSDPSLHSPRFAPNFIQKSWVRCCALYSKLKVGAPLHLCFVSLCVCTVGFMLWPLFKNIW